MKYIVCYFIIISFFSVLFIVADKWQSKNDGIRISERTLFLLAIFGGSVAIYITMFLAHHKTRKLKFTVGIPIIIFLQVLVFFLYNKYI